MYFGIGLLCGMTYILKAVTRFIGHHICPVKGAIKGGRHTRRVLDMKHSEFFSNRLNTFLLAMNFLSGVGKIFEIGLTIMTFYHSKT